MKLLRRVASLMLAVCLLCSSFGSDVLAAEGIPDIVGNENELNQKTPSDEMKSDNGGSSENPEGELKDSGDDILGDTDNDADNNSDADSVGDDGIVNDGENDNSEGNDTIADGDTENKTEEDIVDNEGDADNDTSGEVADDENAEPLLTADGSGDVSRIEWLSALTKTFNMSVEKDNYPDNYYVDIESSSEYYYDVMLATEFGLIDVEAGEELKPDEAATREFAAHTLNFCLGYMPQEDGKYTFNESSKVTYADDIQIAIDRGWFELVDGDFLPDMAITSNEKDAMLDDARIVFEAAKPDPTHNNTYTFADGVIDLTNADISVELTDVTELTFYNCSETLAVGNKYGMEQGGLPTVFKITSVTEEEEGKVVQFETVPMDEAFKDIDIQGSMDIDLASVLPYNDDVEMYYIVGGTEEEQWEDGIKYNTLEEVGGQEISAIEAVATYAISDNFSQDVDIGPGVKASVSCKVSDVKPDFSASIMNKSAYVGVNAKVSLSCNVNANLIEAAGVVPNLKLVYIPIAGIGYFDVSMYAMMGGKLTLDLVENVHIGLRYENSTFRMEKSFTKDSFTIQSRIEMDISATARLGMSVCNIMKGEIYAKLGVRNVLDTIVYDDGNTPKMCGHHSAWFYAKVGGVASVDFGFYSDSWNKEYKIYDENNSPVRVSFHYEDGVAVSSCTRGTQYGASGKSWRYHTSANSRYGYNGASSGIGSNGEPYTIFEYSLDKYDNATITSYKGNVSALSIPETLDGYTVVGIGRNVFRNNSLLRVVVIPDSVVKIEDYAFSECVNLSKVELSSSLTSLGGDAFYNCDSITEIAIPKSLEMAYLSGPFRDCDGLKKVSFEKGTTKIVTCLFYGCTGIEEISIPDTVTIVQSYAFSDCTNLYKIVIPDTVTEIHEYAFRNCIKLEKIVIPDSVVEIGDGSFYSCTNLESVTLSKGLSKIGGNAFYNCDLITEIEIPKSLKNAWSGPFSNCDGLKKVSFEEGTTEIAHSLFRNCTGIEEIDIPNTVTIIEEMAFENCTNLYNVTISSSVSKIEEYAFQACTKLEKIIIPDSVEEIEWRAFSGCINLSSVTLSKGLNKMGGSAFDNCDLITEIEIPKSLKNAWSGPFSNCDGLKKVIFEEGTTEIVNSLFCNCTGIEEIEIPDTVTVIEVNAFDGCTNLCKVTIPSSVTKIEEYAFRKCTKLETITLLDSITDIGNDVFASCSALKEVVLPNAISEIRNGTFKDCISLEKVNFPESLENIRSHAFYNTKLTEAILPEKLKTIENYAFYNCDALTKVEMQNNLTSIGNYAFYDCDALTAITIPDSVTSLGTYIFTESERLSDVTLGTGITTIPTYAFNLCPLLNKIVIPYRVTEIKGNAFTNCTTLTEITIPRSVTTIASGVFSYPSKLTIYGISGTYAETYANSIGATFVHKEVKATSVSLNNEELKIAKGVKATLIMSVVPSDFTDEVSWKSTDESIVTVGNDGVVTAKTLGTATVKVTVGSLSASCKITVTQPVTSISLNKTALSLEALESYKLTATVSPSTAENKEIIWSSSDEEIASVDENGLVTTYAKGSATIRVEAQDGSGVYKECNVTVVNNGYICSNVNELESEHDYPVNSSDFWIYTKEGAEKLYVTFDARTDIEEDFDYLYIYDAQGKEVGKYTGTQLTEQVVEVEGDTVKIKLVSDDSGTAWGFKVTSVSDSSNITVTQPVTSISLNKDSLSLEAFESDTLTVEVSPSTADNKAVIWSSSDEEIASVDENGLVTAHAKGSATIRVEAQDGSGVYKECSVTVVNNGYICSNTYELESEHDYPVNSSDFWIYTSKGAENLYITFDERTEIEEGNDYLYIYDFAGNHIGKYTGKELSGQTVKIFGDTVKIKLESDASGTAWGFKVTSITTTGGEGPGDEDNTEGLKIIFTGAYVDENGNYCRTYIGSAIKPEIEVTNNGGLLTEGIDYTVKYSNNIKAAKRTDKSAPKVTVTGKGNYSGSTFATFTIEPKDISNEDYTESEVLIGGMDDEDNTIVVASGTKLSPVIVYNGMKLGSKDYELNKAGEKFTDATADKTIKITGKGNYTGEMTLNVKVKDKADLIKFTVSVDTNTKLTYNGDIQDPKIKVITSGNEKKDITDEYGAYYISYGGDRTSAGTQKFTVIGLGSYSGAVSKTYKIQPVKNNIIEKELMNTSYEYVSTGVKFAEGDLKVTDKTFDKELVEGIDYKVTYSSNKKVGTAKYKITFIGNYKGTKAITDGTFRITQSVLEDDDFAIRVKIPDKVCKAGANCKSAPYVTINGVTVKASEYIVTYSTDYGATYSTSPKADFIYGDAATVYVKITAKGDKNYMGELTGEYTVWNKESVGKKDISKAKVTFYAIDDRGNVTGTKLTKVPYTGELIELNPSQIKLTIGNVEVPESAYDYTIINNLNKGKAVVIINVIDDSTYMGSKTATFSIVAKKFNN